MPPSDSSVQDDFPSPHLRESSSVSDGLSHGARFRQIESARRRDSFDVGFASPREIVANLLSPGLNGSPLSRAGRVRINSSCVLAIAH